MRMYRPNKDTKPPSEDQASRVEVESGGEGTSQSARAVDQQATNSKLQEAGNVEEATTSKEEDENQAAGTVGTVCKACNEVVPSVAEHKCKRFTCKACMKRFQFKHQLNSHIRVHTGEKPFTCEICKESFRVNELLSIHKAKFHSTQSHNPNREICRCDVCNREYKGKSFLIRHLQFHEKNNFACYYCKKQMKTGERLQRHLRKHKGSRPFRCRVCRQRFSCRSSLGRHKCGEVTAPFACDMCPSRYRRRYDLHVHQRKMHTVRQKPFICPHCGEFFTDKPALTSHLEMHEIERAHVCDLCDKSFDTRRTLQMHKQAVHTPETLITLARAASNKNTEPST